MRKKKIRFIINPVSGNNNGHGKNTKKVPRFINKYLDQTMLEPTIYFTKKPGHAGELAAEAVRDKEDMVVAVGGDGCVHEIGRELIGTSTFLGIIPTGSGNGIARHLGIPQNLRKAVLLFNNYRWKSIDTGMMNDQPFIGVFGLGFDARVGKAFEQSRYRGLLNYIKISILTFFKYKGSKFYLKIEDKNTIQTYAHIICVANTNQYGNNTFIAPKASVLDGQLNISVIRKFPFLAIFALIYRVFSGNIYQSSYVDGFLGRNICIEHSEDFGHVDGEPIPVLSKIYLRVIPQSLNVLIPVNGKNNL